jgi:hypothetical protein
MRITKSIEELLFEILEELKKMNKGNEPINDKKDFGRAFAETPEERILMGQMPLPKTTKTYKCKYCGGEHEQPWEIAKCGKTKKKG